MPIPRPNLVPSREDSLGHFAIQFDQIFGSVGQPWPARAQKNVVSSQRTRPAGMSDRSRLIRDLDGQLVLERDLGLPNLSLLELPLFLSSRPSTLFCLLLLCFFWSSLTVHSLCRHPHHAYLSFCPGHGRVARPRTCRKSPSPAIPECSCNLRV